MSKKKKHTIFNQAEKDFLTKYLNNPSPAGYEAEGQKIWLNYIKPYADDHLIDPYGTAAAIKNPGQEFKVVIEAHADEIAWYVNYVKKDGLMNVIRLGGSDHMVALAKRVNVHTDKGIVKGIFGWPAIHTRKRSTEKSPKVEQIFLDVGAKSKKEVEEMGIHPGTPITFDDEVFEMNERYYVGRALDNRMGGFIIAQVFRLLQENDVSLDYSLYAVNAVQEEVGLRGAQMIAERIKPNAAFVTDVTHDTTTPMIKKSKEGELACGKGPVLAHAPAVHNKLLQHTMDCAKEKDIDFQHSASSRSTGTDTDSFAYSNSGVPSVLISLPLRYMHTPVEAAHISDIEATIKLMYESIIALKPDFDFNYF